MKIGIVGYGYVGQAMYNFFKDHYEVIYYDPFKDGSCTKEDINKCNLAIVCVMTPEKNNGECDIHIVEEVVEWIESPLILIKSTVSVGTTNYLINKTNKNIVFSPEYIGEGKYDTGIYNFNKDMKKHGFYTFGGNSINVNKIINIFQQVGGPNKIYRATDAISAELAKYAENCFLASKVIFCYEMEQICKHLGTNWNEVRELWLLDPRIGTSHTSVFESSNLPFSGKCLPKDLKALIHTSYKNNYDPKFLKEIWTSNVRIGNIREKEKLE